MAQQVVVVPSPPEANARPFGVNVAFWYAIARLRLAVVVNVPVASLKISAVLVGM